MITKCKRKAEPTTGHEGPDGEYRYSFTIHLTSALDGGGWLTPRPGRFTPEKETLYPFYKMLSAPQGQSGRVRKILPQLGFGPRTFHPVEISYNGYALLVHDYKVYLSFKTSYMFRHRGAILTKF